MRLQALSWLVSLAIGCLALSGCKQEEPWVRPADTEKPLPKPSRHDHTVPVMKVDSSTKTRFLDKARVVKVIGYSFLDHHTVEIGTRVTMPLLPGTKMYAAEVYSTGLIIVDTMTIMPHWSIEFDPRWRNTVTIVDTSRISQLLMIINDRGNYTKGRSGCFFPNNIFCFFNGKGEIIGYYVMCFQCGQCESNPVFQNSLDGNFTEKGYKALKSFCASVGLDH